jgi:8-oxo-dGTP pyrophosphatase MutT (NUDIX family)
MKPSFLFRQSGVIPYRWKGNHVEVLLITSHTGSRWVIPKGVIDSGLSAADSAIKEAQEEAGVLGRISSQALGEFTYQKWGGTCRVQVFVLEVEQEMEDWPEARIRKREWVSLEEACERINEDGLRALLSRLPELLKAKL